MPFAAYAQAPDVRLPLTVVVSLDQQFLVVFEGENAIGESSISSGKAGHTTPSGIFSILEKRPTHFSNIYDNAPMPFMQRLTWSGIALHGSGHVPNYPASHGCIRLPHAFAEELFAITERGAHVVIANTPVWPQRLHHPALIQPAEASLMTSSIRGSQSSGRFANTIEIADATPQQTLSDATAETDMAPLRLYVTRRTRNDSVRDAQALLNELNYDAGTVDGMAGRQTIAALKAFQKDVGLAETGTVSPADIDALREASGRGPIPNGHLYARRRFEPIFDVPVHIERDDLALGTHLLTVEDIEGGFARWIAIGLSEPEAADTPQDQADAGSIMEIGPHAGTSAPVTVDPFRLTHDALDRIVIDIETRQTIAGLLTPGSSMAISDNGIGPETGRGTDFIVITG